MIRKKIVYSNGPSQVHVSFPVNDDSNRTAYMFKILNEDTQKTEASKGRCRS